MRVRDIMAKFGKHDLVDKMVEVYGAQEDGKLTKKEALRLVNTFAEAVKGLVQEEGDVLDLQSFVKFEKRLSPSRKGTNPGTGEAIVIPEKVRTVAKPKF